MSQTESKQLWVATHNRDKFKEIKELLKETGLEVHGAFEMPHYSVPVENGATFLDNARIKAKSLHALKHDSWVLADDSGLELPALKNLPGVFSARYAGPTARDIENTAKLVRQLHIQNVIDRTAFFKCVICLLPPLTEGNPEAAKAEKIFEGLLKGTISKDMRGKTGFGYDPVFIPENETKTLAELGMAMKNRLSHRAQALRQARSFLIENKN